MPAPAPIGIFYHADPLGHVPSGIDSFIRSLLKWAPEDLRYTLYGATSDLVSRPLGRASTLEFGKNGAQFVPLVYSDPTSTRNRIPLTIRYLWALRARVNDESLRGLQALDFHRIESLILFGRDQRPKNITIHNDMAVIRDDNCDMAWRHAPWLYEALERRLFFRADRVFAVRQSAVVRYRDVYPTIANRFLFLPTAVDTDVFGPSAGTEQRLRTQQALRAQFDLGETIRILTFVGRLDSQKDPLLLLTAFTLARRRDRSLHLVIVGDGALRPKVEAYIAEQNMVQHVTLLGAKRPAEIADILRGSDLFVLSSAYEGMPIAVLEALATGLPVVSTNVGEIAGTVRNGANGQISEERTSESLAQALATALAGAAQMRGAPCVNSVTQFHPEIVFGAIYENHRRQAAIGKKS